MPIRHCFHPIRGILTTAIRNLSRLRLRPGPAPGMELVAVTAEELAQAMVAAMVRAMAAIPGAAIDVKEAAVRAAVAAALITIKSSVARMSLLRPAYLKNRSRLIQRPLARTR